MTTEVLFLTFKLTLWALLVVKGQGWFLWLIYLQLTYDSWIPFSYSSKSMKLLHISNSNDLSKKDYIAVFPYISTIRSNTVKFFTSDFFGGESCTNILCIIFHCYTE